MLPILLTANDANRSNRASSPTVLTQPTLVSEDTRRPLGATHQVQTGSDDVFHLSPPGQMFGDDHLEEVKGCVETVLVQLQLTAQLLNLAPPCGHK